MYPTLIEYAYMAQACYGKTQQETEDKMAKAWIAHSQWTIYRHMPGLPHDGGNWGFQGVIFENLKAGIVVCAFKGSKGGFFDKSTTGYDDWCVNDLQIARNQIPNQTPHAVTLAELGKKRATKKGASYSLVGHSLGGGLAQLVGVQLNAPFVTFNAPGMVKNMPAKINHPGRARGFNMILSTDPVGNTGEHIGKTERFMNLGSVTMVAHKMNAVISTLQRDYNVSWATRQLDQLLA